MSNSRTNIYDKLVVFYITLQIFGIIGGALIPIRIFIVTFTPAMITFFLQDNTLASYYKYEFKTFLIWICWGIISLLWVYFPDESIKEVIYLIVHFLGFFLLIYFSSKAQQPKESIIKGWILLFILTLPIAFVEIFLDIHLPVAYQSNDFMMNYGAAGVFARRFASVSYGNLNRYNTMLAYMLPFIMGSLINLQKNSRISKILLWILVLTLSFLLIINGSRAGLICLLIGIFIFVSFYIKNTATLIGVGLLFASAVLILIFSDNEYLKLVFMRLETQGLEDEGRSNMIRFGLKELERSNFLGVGAANFTPTIERHYISLETVDPHNFFLEVLVQYGILIFALFIGLFVKIIKKNKENINKRYKYIIVGSLFIYPVLTIIDSGYLVNMSTWLFLASLYIIADKNFMGNHNELAS